MTDTRSFLSACLASGGRGERIEKQHWFEPEESEKNGQQDMKELPSRVAGMCIKM